MQEINEILIVEDEKAARDRLISMKLWESNKYRICATAGNGKEGLLAYKNTNPDIIITDIEMPVMNGLDLIKEIRKENKHIPIIILSCYESFSYAQKAIQLKVSDYLIKDFLEEEVLLATLDNALRKQVKDNITAAATLSTFRAEYTTDLFSIFEEQDQNKISKLKQKYSSKNFFSLLYLHIDYYNRTKHDIKPITNAISNELSSECDSMISNIGNGYFAVLLTGDKDLLFSEIASRLLDYVNHHCSVSVTISAGNIFKEPDCIQGEYQKVKEILKYSIFLGQKRVILPSHISQLSWLNPEIVDNTLHKIKVSLLKDDKEMFLRNLKQLYKINTAGMIEYNYMEYVNSSIIALLLTYIDEKNVRESEDFNPELLDFKRLHSMETIEDIYFWFKQKFLGIFSLTAKMETRTLKNIHIKELINIINVEFMSDLSLETLANRIGIHKVYLSRIFKENTGKTCYEYIQLLRVKKAKELLLSSSHKMSIIAEKTGFRNYDQFAVVFKKIVGESPTLFQKKYK